MDKIKRLSPILLIVFVTVLIAVKNITPDTYFTGWDNTHPELNLIEFTKRVFSGAWVEFQGTGAPAAQSQLAELARLPYIYILKLFVPTHLIRYVFMYLMVLTGGIGIYFFIKNIFLSKIEASIKQWIACFGGLYYILNIVSIQQFYINFELYAVQFAYFPVVLSSIYYFSTHFSFKNFCFFILALILFIPTAYVPTIVYIAFIFITIYTFFVNLQIQRNLYQAVKKTLFILFITLIINSFWILPNIHYVLNNAGYVEKSRSNQLFAMEALSSVKESGNIENLLTGIHYLFNWKDYNFQTKQYEFIFEPWIAHLSGDVLLYFLVFFNLLTFYGLVTLIIDRKHGLHRWGLILPFLFTGFFIWIGLMGSNFFIDLLYNFGPFKEAFRNPFTKLSNYYSFFATLMLCQSLGSFYALLHNSRFKKISKYISFFIIFLFMIFLIYTSLPAFQGNFLNPKLRTHIPDEYFDMFKFLSTKPKNSRILELPFFSDAGWLYYDWTSQAIGNGYQGMGFYIFGVTQPLLTPDHARWTESSDFFYHELRHALNSKSSILFKNVLDKYIVNMVIIDEKSIAPYLTDYDYTFLHNLINEVGFDKVWNEQFLTVYERKNSTDNAKLIIPNTINLVSSERDRARIDQGFQNAGEYISSSYENAHAIYPFSELTKLQSSDIVYTANSYSLSKKLSDNRYTVRIPTLKDNIYSTFLRVNFDGEKLKFQFPKTTLRLNNQVSFAFPQFDDFEILLDQVYEKAYFWLDTQLYEIKKNQEQNTVVHIPIRTNTKIFYAGMPDANTNIDLLQYESITINHPQLLEWSSDIHFSNIKLDKIEISTAFPAMTVLMNTLKSENCTSPQLGTIDSSLTDNDIIYTANQYGVNCSSHRFEGVTPDYPFILRLKGTNLQGRSIKFIVDYNIKNSIPEAYLMPQKKFDETIILYPITDFSLKTYGFNWETRSYGKTSQNKLQEMSVFPFPADIASQIQVRKNDFQSIVQNKVKVKKSSSYLTFLYVLDLECNNAQCYFGINQSYDKLWLAFDSKLNQLPHFQYNNWANLWSITQPTRVIIIYIPQLISYGCILLTICFLCIVVLDKKTRSFLHSK